MFTYSYNVLLFFVTAVLLFGPLRAQGQARYPVIPKPSMLTEMSGEFQLNRNTKVYIGENTGELKVVTDFLIALIKSATGYTLNFTTKPGKNTISFQQEHAIQNREGYKLFVAADGISIRYSSSNGAFFAVQTLRQLMPADVEAQGRLKTISVPAVSIQDAPHFAYRGFMLDVARHFQPIGIVKRYIDLLAFYKINTFHLHLTDDQGWRVEIKKYPKLHEVAAWRNETRVGHRRDEPVVFDGKRHGGFYTQAELKDLVAYAQSRYITIIPEIEMPGHSHAVLAAYPELGCKDTTYQVSTNWGVHKDVYCPTETTFKFLEDVLDEVMDIFPGKYIHIGGDEVPKDRWRESAYAQSLIQKHDLKDENGLQSYFINRMEEYLNSNGRSIIGWDEIMDGGLSPNTTVMSWHYGKVGEAARGGNYEIITSNPYLYFDYYQTKEGREREPVAIGHFLPLHKVYSFNPIPENLPPENRKYVLGVQANLWTEYVATVAHAEQMTFPRLCALAEVGWTDPNKKDYPDFVNRLNQNLKHLDKLQVNYAKYYLEDNQE